MLDCLHCGQPVPSGRDKYCCQGCAIVAQLLKEADLSLFYDLKPARILPQINYFSRHQDFAWLNQLSGMESGFISVDIEGIQCAACVWVISEIARRISPETKVDVDVVLGRLSVSFIPEKFSMKDFAEKLFRLGYRIKNQKGASKKENDGLLLRLGVCSAISMNTMFLAICLYAGLNQEDPSLFELITRINFYLSFITVIVGGSYFFHRAYLSLRSKILHFDLSITIGILAAFGGSMLLHLQGRGEQAYFDTVNIFITLMLAGRFVQERILQKNRNALLVEDELSELKMIRVGKSYETIALKDVVSGDVLLLQPGSLVPVDCLLEKSAADFSLSWISGESLPVTLIQGDKIPAGAQLVSAQGVLVKASDSFERSPIRTLKPKYKEESFLPVVWQWVIARYVLIVLTMAVVGYVSWYFIDASRALNVLTAILVVTCPCSLGVAIPLARVLADYSMRKWGVFVRGGAVFDKLLGIQNIFFDKTGTLTLATLEWVNKNDFLNQVSPEDLIILYNMVVQSRHPASQSIYQELSTHQLLAQALTLTEIPGKGLEGEFGGQIYHLGKFSKKDIDIQNNYIVCFLKESQIIGELIFREKILEQSASVIESLQQQKLNLYLLSGDKTNRVEDFAREVGINQWYGDLSPQDKADLVEKQGGGASLVIGDGLNDSKAFQRASLSGTPVWDYSTMAQGADFYYISGNLVWLTSFFKVAHCLKNTIRLNLYFSLLFNVSAISLALSGRLTPLMAALIMPLGSLFILGFTIRRMKGEGK